MTAHRTLAIVLAGLVVAASPRSGRAAPDLRHLGPPRRVNDARRAELERLATLPGGVGQYWRESVAGRSSGPAHFATWATSLLAPDQALLNTLSWTSAGALTLDRQLDRVATHIDSERAFAQAELRRLEGKPGAAGQTARGVFWRALESTSRGGLAGASLFAFFTGLSSTQGFDPARAARLTAAGGAGGAALGLLTGVAGAIRRTAGRSMKRRVADGLFGLRLRAAERSLARLLGERAGSDKRAVRLARLERKLFRLDQLADALLALDAEQTRRLQRLLRGFDAVAVFAGEEPIRPGGETKAGKAKEAAARAPHRRLARLAMTGLLVSTLANQGFVGRIPIASMPSDLLQDPSRQQLAELFWRNIENPEVARLLTTREPLGAFGALFTGEDPPAQRAGESAWADARMHRAFHIAYTFRNRRSARQKLLEVMGAEMRPDWEHDAVMADVAHFYTAAWLASQGGTVVGAPLTGALSLAYELGFQRTLLPNYDGRYQLEQLITADLPGAAYGAVSSYLRPPP